MGWVFELTTSTQVDLLVLAQIPSNLNQNIHVQQAGVLLDALGDVVGVETHQRQRAIDAVLPRVLQRPDAQNGRKLLHVGQLLLNVAGLILYDLLCRDILFAMLQQGSDVVGAKMHLYSLTFMHLYLWCLETLRGREFRGDRRFYLKNDGLLWV